MTLAELCKGLYTRKDAEEWVALQSSKDPAEHFAICDATGPIGGIGVNTERGDSTNSATLWASRSGDEESRPPPQRR